MQGKKTSYLFDWPLQVLNHIQNDCGALFSQRQRHFNRVWVAAALALVLSD